MSYRMPWRLLLIAVLSASPTPRAIVACADYLKDFFIGHVAAENTAALIVEPVMGEGGFITPAARVLSQVNQDLPG